MTVGLLLTSCTGDDEGAAPTPPPTSASDPTEPPTAGAPTEPTLPANAVGASTAAAERFVEHYINLVNYTLSSGDVAPYRQVIKRECARCADYVQRVQEIYDAGGFFRGGQLRAQKISLTVRPPGQLVFSVAGRSHDGELRESDQGQVEAVPGEAVMFALALEREGEQWRIADIIN